MNTLRINYVNLKAQWRDERNDLSPIIEEVMSSGQFIGGEPVERFEKSVAKLCDTKYCVALNSGTDALVCGLMALGVQAGDEIITPPNSFIASTGAIVHLRAKPVFVDVLPDQNIDPKNIELAITEKTKAIMPVHLTGRVAAMKEILEIGNHFNIPVIEDAAQSVGSLYSGKPSGSFGKVGCFSVHPLKNLNACGDGGFITTNDSKIASQIISVRNHGLVDRDVVERFGYVSRMDALQASILEFRLSKLPDIIRKRRNNASIYYENLDKRHVYFPTESKKEFNTYHTFIIQCDNRNELMKYLFEKGIETFIHYPIPIHLQPAAKNLGYSSGDLPISEMQAKKILSLPIHQYLTNDEILHICETVNNFFN